MKMRALFLLVISTILTSSWTKKYFLVEPVDKKDEIEASLPPEDSKLPPEDSKLPPEDDSIPAKSDYQHHGMSIAEILGVQNSGLWWVKENTKSKNQKCKRNTKQASKRTIYDLGFWKI